MWDIAYFVWGFLWDGYSGDLVRLGAFSGCCIGLGGHDIVRL